MKANIRQRGCENLAGKADSTCAHIDPLGSHELARTRTAWSRGALFSTGADFVGFWHSAEFAARPTRVVVIWLQPCKSLVHPSILQGSRGAVLAAPAMGIH